MSFTLQPGTLGSFRFSVKTYRGIVLTHTKIVEERVHYALALFGKTTRLTIIEKPFCQIEEVLELDFLLTHDNQIVREWFAFVTKAINQGCPENLAYELIHSFIASKKALDPSIWLSPNVEQVKSKSSLEDLLNQYTKNTIYKNKKTKWDFSEYENYNILYNNKITFSNATNLNMNKFYD